MAVVVTRYYSAATVLLLGFLSATTTMLQSIGVNYGTVGDNLPPPSQVAQFLKDKTTIDRIKIFDVNHEILSAFADTGILVAVTVPNVEIPTLTNLSVARRWVTENIRPFHPRTKINYILVGSEILHWGPQVLIDNLVSAMWTLNQALLLSGIKDIKVTTAHSLGILESSNPPSMARFRPGWAEGVLTPLLRFHKDTKSPFMVNPYPFFSYNPENASFSLFGPNSGVFDKFTKRNYGNMFDLLMDAVYVSMMRLGYKDVEIAVGETGWASAGESFEQPRCSVENAAAYNGGLVRKYNSGRGTPLMRRRRFETYIFGLFNENQKSGPLSERNFGLFRNDFSPVYDIGILRCGRQLPVPKPSVPSPAGDGKLWCLPTANATDPELQANIDYVCGQGVNCQPIQFGGACFEPNNVRSHALFVMNAYYQNYSNCYFSGSGMITSTDPSTNTCKYDS
ncbi:hypothetical protein OROGR_015844 [Orobanche gracilis]